MKGLGKRVIGLVTLMGVAYSAFAADRGITIKGLEDQAGVKVGTYRALVIGIDDYLDPKIPDLKTAAADARSVAQLLQRSYGFSDVTLLLDRQADESNIVKQLRRLATKSQADDAVLIYYAGHGDLDKVLGDGWWVPANATAQDSSTYLDNTVIQKYIKKIPARHVLLVSDSCFSGTLFGETRALPSVIDDRYYANLFKERSRWGMTSGNLTPVSDSGSGGHSTFAYQFIKALSDNTKPFMTPREIYQQIAPIISNNSSQMPLTKPIRNADDQGGEFVFIRSDGQVEAASKRGQASAATGGNAMELAFWNAIKDSTDPAQFQAYLNRFPNGTFAELARLKLQMQPLAAKQLPVHKVRAAGVDFETVALPGGHFAMGSSRGNDSERPVHQVRLDPFEMMTAEVTVGQFRAFVQQSDYRTEAERSGGCDRADFRTGQWSRITDANWMNPGFEQGEDSPVVCVSWNDATAFAQWLSKTTGDHFQLPTEAQWEYAARAGTTTAYSFGDDVAQLCRYGNGADQSMARAYPGWVAADCDDGFSTRTAPVGYFQPNGFGLFDMHGNVFEWCLDRAHPTYQGAPGDGSEWEEGGMQPRILRGGGWYNAPVDLRSSFRHWSAPTNRSFNTGFRLVREAAPSSKSQPGLTIQVTPSDARIRILNIGPKYQAGMRLEPGRYHIEVSKSGYFTQAEWVELGSSDMTHKMRLDREEISPSKMVTIPAGSFQMLSNEIDRPIATGMSRPDAVAVVIGIQEYKSPGLADVPGALHDAEVMRDYLTNTLGFSERNIIFITGAELSDFRRIFGDERNHEGKLFNWVRPLRSDLFIFYSGYGAPDPESMEGHMLPSDADPAAVGSSAYPLSLFYKNLKRLIADKHPRSVVVAMDSCFSTSSDEQLQIQSVVSMSHTVVLSSSGGDRLCSRFSYQGHGLFTYSLLNFIRQIALRGETLSTGDLADNLSSDFSQANTMLQRLYDRSQNPTVTGDRNIILLDAAPHQSR